MNNPQQIESSDSIDTIETPFRVHAGPGAGKTYWLVRHIREVLEKSERLGPGRRVACISYTNTAVEELQEDLYSAGIRGDEVEVSTIHSFLYSNIIRPYVHLLKDENGDHLVNFCEVDGHEEHTTSYRWVRRWLERCGRSSGLANNLDKWKPYLDRATWLYEDGDWQWRRTQPWAPKYLPTTELFEYKLCFWERGILHHEDVPYLAYRILDEIPELRSFLSARFPYIFIDEFQDTGLAQAQIARWLSENGTIVGVIGDMAQSIYSFRGARREEFEEFTIDDLMDFEIPTNRRSTRKIVDFLNEIRLDHLFQEPHTDAATDEWVQCVVGSPDRVYDLVSAALDKVPPTILVRKNSQVGEFRRIATQGEVPNSDVWKKYADAESDAGRARFLLQLLRSTRTARAGRIGLAIREMAKGIRIRGGKIKDPFKCDDDYFVSSITRRALGVTVVNYVASYFEDSKNISLKEMYNNIVDTVDAQFSEISMKRLTRRGKGGKVADTHNFGEFYAAVSVSGKEGNSPIQTMHKSKGAEFENVLVWFDSDGELRNALRPDENDENELEEHRVRYVGMSRAKQRLFLGVPTLDDGLEEKLIDLRVTVQRVGAPEPTQEALSEGVPDEEETPAEIDEGQETLFSLDTD